MSLRLGLVLGLGLVLVLGLGLVLLGCHQLQAAAPGRGGGHYHG